MRRLTVTMAAALVLAVLGPMPAAAQKSTTDLAACPDEVVPDLSFTDLDPASVHDLDIDWP